MVCSLDLDSGPEDRPVARQLLYSIKKYMNSDLFDPEYSLDPDLIRRLFIPPSGPGYNSYTGASTDDLIPQSGKN